MTCLCTIALGFVQTLRILGRHYAAHRDAQLVKRLARPLRQPLRKAGPNKKADAGSEVLLLPWHPCSSSFYRWLRPDSVHLTAC